MKNLNKTLVALACAAAVPCAMAEITTLDVGFNAPQQSLWGGGPSFGYSGSGDTGGAFAAWYRYAFSSGAVQADLAGRLVSNHDTTLLAPGVTQIDLGFLGNSLGGHIESSFGASAAAGVRVDIDTPWYVPIPDIHINKALVDVGFSLVPDANFTPAMGQRASMSDRYDLPVAGFDIEVVSASVNVGVQQQSAFDMAGIAGLLSYNRRGTSEVFSTPVLIDGDGTHVNVNLSQAGLWDFSFNDLTVRNTLSTGFDLTLGASIDSWFGGWSSPVLPIRIVNVPGFELAFDQVDTATAFTIAVVPEPSTYAMLGLGLAALGLRRRRLSEAR